jgi:hypothetical protein
MSRLHMSPVLRLVVRSQRLALLHAVHAALLLVKLVDGIAREFLFLHQYYAPKLG